MLGRSIKIRTRTCVVETPALFPVHNAGVRGRGENTPRFWETIPEIPHVMLNARFLHNSNLFDELSRVGLHSFLGTRGAVFLDSGGLQARTFHFDLDPIEVMHVQEQLGADIGTVVDYPILPSDPKYSQSYVRHVRANVRAALRCDKERDGRMLLYVPIHANDEATFTSLVKHLRLEGDFDGFAIGGLIPRRSEFRPLVRTILKIRRAAGDMPIHAFGMGGPSMLPFLCGLGVDTFDSSSYIKAGANRVYFLPGKGSSDIRDLQATEYLPCVCPICSTNSSEQVRNQRRLIALHNLWCLALELRNLRRSIKGGYLDEYLGDRFRNNVQMRKCLEFARYRMRDLRTA